jgi:glycerol-3-phosphate responsive antiterminator
MYKITANIKAKSQQPKNKKYSYNSPHKILFLKVDLVNGISKAG